MNQIKNIAIVTLSLMVAFVVLCVISVMMSNSKLQAELEMAQSSRDSIVRLYNEKVTQLEDTKVDLHDCEQALAREKARADGLEKELFQRIDDQENITDLIQRLKSNKH